LGIPVGVIICAVWILTGMYHDIIVRTPRIEGVLASPDIIGCKINPEGIMLIHCLILKINTVAIFRDKIDFVTIIFISMHTNKEMLLETFVKVLDSETLV
jgi:hypothetical protein